MTETRTRTDAGHHERDLYDLPLTTTPEAAALFRDAQERLLKVQIGAAPLLQRAVLADPGFAVGQATLALLGHDFDVSLDTARHLRLARQSALRATDRERSFVDVAASRVRGSHDHLARLLRHLAEHPRDALVLNLAVPTVAFSGRVEVPEQAWALVEAARPSFGSDWWYAGLLAFVRQEQGHFVEAGELALGALAIEPAAGHAAHASCHRPRCRACVRWSTRRRCCGGRASMTRGSAPCRSTRCCPWSTSSCWCVPRRPSSRCTLQWHWPRAVTPSGCVCSAAAPRPTRVRPTGSSSSRSPRRWPRWWISDPTARRRSCCG